MGFYFNGTDTREVVSRNFNSIRKLFGLNSQKLAELMEPLARIPYQKVRRLAAGERDITAEELNALYELLAVPPATFTFPWSLQDKQSSKIRVLLHEAHLSKNPIFDHLGTPLYPYEFGERKLASSSACRRSTDKFSLPIRARQGKTDRQARIYEGCTCGEAANQDTRIYRIHLSN